MSNYEIRFICLTLIAILVLSLPVSAIVRFCLLRFFKRHSWADKISRQPENKGADKQTLEADTTVFQADGQMIVQGIGYVRIRKADSEDWSSVRVLPDYQKQLTSGGNKQIELEIIELEITE